MDEQEVFAYLAKQKKGVLLDYLRTAFGEMTAKQRRNVFSDAVDRTPKTVDGGELLQEIEEFHRASLAGDYYAPFMINSKNWTHVPEETEQWCDLFAGFVAKASRLTARRKHEQAVACFALLFELFDAFNSGKEIVFAEEVGSWMIPTQEKVWIKDYLTSLAATSTPEAFTAAVLPMLRSDKFQSDSAQVARSARAVATPEQKAHLER